MLLLVLQGSFSLLLLDIGFQLLRSLGPYLLYVSLVPDVLVGDIFYY